MSQDLPIIIFVSSSLQLATFRLSSFGHRDVCIVGSRGMKGNITYVGSTLNDPRFLVQLDGIIGDRMVEVFIPNSINGLFYLCASHPKIARISYLNEGRLTQRFLDYQHHNPSHPASAVLRRAFGMVRWAPRRSRGFLYRGLCVLLRNIALRPYVDNTAGYKFRTIERRWKPGLILFHLPIKTACQEVEIVDLLRDLDFPTNFENHSCLFINKPDIESAEKIDALIETIAEIPGPLLIQPHPNLVASPEEVKNLTERLDKEQIIWKFAAISGRQDVAIELYARGVRHFMAHDSTVLDMISSLPNFFLDLRLTKF